MKNKAVRVLLVEDHPEQVEFLEEAFREMEETCYSRWAGGVCHREYTADVAEAAERLRTAPCDVVLLDVTSGSPPGLPSFLRLRAQAPNVPVVVLAPAREEVLAMSLVRQGAQDYILFEEADCVPLAHSVRCAIERHRLWEAQRSVSLIDDLTGLYNSRGFWQLAERDVRLARSNGLHTLVAGIRWQEPDGVRTGSQDGDLLTIQIAEMLRDLASETDLVGRRGDHEFALLALGADADQCQRRRLRLESSLRSLQRGLAGPASRGLNWGACVMGPGETDVARLWEAVERELCENKQLAHRAGRHV